MNKIAKDLEDAATQHNSKVLYWQVNKLRGSSQYGLAPVKDNSGATIIDKEKVKRWAEHLENALNPGRFTGKDIEKNEKVCITLDIKEDVLCKEELVTVLNG